MTTGEHLQGIVDHHYKAFTEPSGEYVWVYIRVMIVLGVIVWAVRYFFFSQKEELNMMIGMDDIGHDVKVCDSSSDDKRKRSKMG